MAQKILIIDDDKINVALVKFGLAESGYEVTAAYDGDEGLKVFDAKKPDLIVLDVHMPRMNGFEFMTELRKRHGYQATPVIMLTANETMEDVFKLEGVKGYFIKPVILPELVETIRQCLKPPRFTE